MTAEALSKEFDVLYSQMTPEKKKFVYQDNYDQAKKNILDMYEIGMEEEKNRGWEDFGLEISESVYSNVWYRIIAGFKEISDIYESLAPRYNDMKKSTLEKLIIFSYMKQNPPGYLSKMAKRMVVKNPGGIPKAEKRYLNDPEYGLVPEKPVYVNGFEGQHLYLGRLKTAEGKRLRFSRQGSMRADGVDGLVDIYLATTNDLFHRPYGKIYLCLYGTENSERAPRGYSLFA